MKLEKETFLAVRRRMTLQYLSFPGDPAMLNVRHLSDLVHPQMEILIEMLSLSWISDDWNLIREEEIFLVAQW